MESLKCLLTLARCPPPSVHSLVFVRTFSLTSQAAARRPPKEEFNNNIRRTRKKTADPFDRRWKWTPKSAEPYNVRGGHMDWTQLEFLHRGVQKPGYVDRETKQFVFVADMVPELIVPSLENFDLKPYVPYNTVEQTTPAFDARALYEATLEEKVLKAYKLEMEKNETSK